MFELSVLFGHFIVIVYFYGCYSCKYVNIHNNNNNNSQ